MREYCSDSLTIPEKDSGKKDRSILEPSRGEIGTKLNIPKARFTIIITEVIK
ncbi:MAG: hypothetical protein G01um101424_39 [Parcubacteria group bacterium Gr01-1014_24]|nr:MAG: hypothetical protein G01um101424_39 [Parcubacteria group bacterium Gr01-1014_24]